MGTITEVRLGQGVVCLSFTSVIVPMGIPPCNTLSKFYLSNCTHGYPSMKHPVKVYLLLMEPNTNCDSCLYFICLTL
jgi:hypothetical protein